MDHEDVEKLLHRNVEDLHVKDVSDLCVVEPSVVLTGDPVWKMVAALVEKPTNRAVYVVNADRKLLGTISFRDIVRVTNARLGARRKGVTAFVQYLKDIFEEGVDGLMRKPVRVKTSTNLLESLRRMEEFKMNDMPVVDDDEKLVGELKGLEILRFALEDIRRGDEETPDVVKAERDARRIKPKDQ